MLPCLDRAVPRRRPVDAAAPTAATGVGERTARHRAVGLL